MKMEDVLMSEFEKNVNEMDAAEMLRLHREEHPVEDETEGRRTEDWAREMIREFETDARAWHHRQGWEAFGHGCYHALVLLACAGGLLCGFRELILVGIGVSSLIMLGGWLGKAKAGWSV